MEILKSLFRSIVRLVAINIALILFFGSAPLLYVTVPFWVIRRRIRHSRFAIPDLRRARGNVGTQRRSGPRRHHRARA